MTDRQQFQVSTVVAVVAAVNLKNWSLTTNRTPRAKAPLPLRLRDIPPAPPAALPVSHPMLFEAQDLFEPPPEDATESAEVRLNSRVRRILRSLRNKFGLYREYNAADFPDHDPDGDVTFQDLRVDHEDASMITDEPNDVLGLAPPALQSQSFFPYPTYNAFLLGDWYWNGNVTKSSSDFAELIKIVGHPEFRPEDVAGTDWRQIDVKLGSTLR